ncbi:MAG: hypothetical protein P8P74_04700 [Crocinitomicaceae bacterium]|nr:hypothetical protein [Crocinitomicaceae bacterium]
MKITFICFIAFSVSLVSCKKKPNYTLTETEIPSNYELDINQDGIVDFAREYSQLSTYDDPVSGSSVIGSFTPRENVSFLYEPNVGYLFLAANDTIHDASTSSLSWYEYPADLISKDWSDEAGWDATWSVNSDMNEYYLAFKLQNGTTDELGWLKLAINQTTGEITIIDQGISSSSYIVI